MENIVIQKYNDEYENMWDSFVETGILGTIFHTRKFINYHPKNRFEDNSILLFLQNELICIVPACKKQITSTNCVIYNSAGDIDIDPNEFTTHNQMQNMTYFSYLGATYGGPVFIKKYFQTRYVSIIIDKIMQYYNNKIEFRLANNIYFEENIFIVYSLLGTKLRMIPEMSWYIDTNTDFKNNITNKSNKTYFLKMLKNENITCQNVSSDDEYCQFHKMLVTTLTDRHNATPTHTCDELLLLKTILGSRQSLYIIKEADIIYGGIFVIKATSRCWYILYMTRNIELETSKQTNSSISMIYGLYSIYTDAKKEGVKYVDYGICVEDRGKILNTGLADFKERSLGGTANARYLFVN